MGWRSLRMCLSLEPLTDQISLTQLCSDRAGQWEHYLLQYVMSYCFAYMGCAITSECLPGRFDRLVYLGVSDSVEARLKILKAITRK